jgi:hypothetical protein
MENFAILYGELYGVTFPDKKYLWSSRKHIAYILKSCLEHAEKAYELAGVSLNHVKKAIRGEGKIEEASNKELLAFAKSAYLFLSLKDKLLSIEGEEPPSSPFKGKGLGYAFRFNEFVAIRKLSEKAEKYEVAGLLSACIERLFQKWYELEYGEVNGKSSAKASPSNLLKEFEGLSAEEIVGKALTYKSFRPYPYLEGLVKAYPDLKPKKPRGRLPK